MQVSAAIAPRIYKPMAVQPQAPVVPAAPPAAKPAKPVAAQSHAIAKWSLIGGTAAGALGIPMLALAGGAGFGLWMLPAALAGAALGALAYGGIGFLIDRLVGHFKK